MHVMKKLLTLNYGSSSIKVTVFNSNLEKLEKYIIKDINPDKLEDYLISIKSQIKTKIDIFVHRVVHGMNYSSPFLLSDENISILEELVKINPLHNYISIRAIKFLRSFGGIHYAVFDTDFHKTIPQEANIYGIDIDLYRKGYKRYGFHGIAFSYIVRKMKEILGKEKINLISIHLGSGCSICAIKESKSIDTSMGFTPLEGLIMQTRLGDIDPGLLIHLLESNLISKWDLYYNCGIKSLAKVNNFIELEKKYLLGDDLAIVAMEAFVYRIVKYIGSYYVLFDNLDGITFSGGIGENSYVVRKLVVSKLKNIGVEIDEDKNCSNDFIINKCSSKLKVFVVKVDEEEEMARKVLEII